MLSRRVAKALESERALADGEYVFRDGDAGGEMYVIRSGRVIISKRYAGSEIILGDLTKGDFFGEMSLLEGFPRDADARAVGDTSVLVIGSGGLLLRLRRDPSFAIEMLTKLSGRIRRLLGQLGDIAEGYEPEGYDAGRT
jgi:CRP-like cAMP-binding protein